jgi:hypothetical protein
MSSRLIPIAALRHTSTTYDWFARPRESSVSAGTLVRNSIS